MSELAHLQAEAWNIRTLLTRFTQDTRLIRLTTPLSVDLLAECVRGEEGVSQGYVFQIDALSTNAHLKIDALLGQPALLQLLTAANRSALRPFHGHITAVELRGANGGFARYALTVEPWSALMGYGRDSRIFQDMTVVDILDTVFRSYKGQGRLAPAWRSAIVVASVVGYVLAVTPIDWIDDKYTIKQSVANAV